MVAGESYLAGKEGVCSEEERVLCLYLYLFTLVRDLLLRNSKKESRASDKQSRPRKSWYQEDPESEGGGYRGARRIPSIVFIFDGTRGSAFVAIARRPS